MSININETIIPVTTSLIVLLLLLVVRRIAIMQLAKWASKTRTSVDDTALAALNAPTIYWCVALAIYFGIAFSSLPAIHVRYLTRAIRVIVLVSITVASANLAGMIFRNYSRRANHPIQTTGIMYGLLKGTVFILGG